MVRTGNTQDVTSALFGLDEKLDAHSTLGSCEGMGLDVTQLENGFHGHSYCTQTANRSPVHKPKSVSCSSLQNPLLLGHATC